MNEKKGAMSIAEGMHAYKTDVELILSDERKTRNYVLRTSLDSLPAWKVKHEDANMAVFMRQIERTAKEKQVSIIDGEVWVFEIDSTKAEDIVASVKIAMNYFNTNASEILSNVYVKNLNAESEHKFGSERLVIENKNLYKTVCEFLIIAAKKIGVKGSLGF